ncbi:MAG: cysteine desulfurase [Clostridia bacterium]|nr:cysteine desulfurase [Clostridia bacterium]
MQAYLDNSATTSVCDEAIKRMNRTMTECWGNPSSLHAAGLLAAKEFDSCTAAAAKMLSCEPEEIFFTSGGTESNNTVLFGVAKAMKKQGNRIVVSAVEHSSIIQPARQLQNQGFDVIFLPVGKDGVIDRDALFEAVNKDTVLVSVMTVNNETGSIQPVELLKKAVRRAAAPALIHTDAVQAFGKIPLKVNALGVDLLSASSHKIHGPKGAGLLYIRSGCKIAPLLYGGEQQQRIRPGTEALPAISGFAGAIQALPDINEEFKAVSSLRNYFLTELKSIENSVVVSPENSLPYIANVSISGMRSETVLNFLSERGVFVSTGSACSKGHRSHVLEALDLPPKVIDGAIRVSFSRFTTKEEIDLLISSLRDAQKYIRH